MYQTAIVCNSSTCLHFQAESENVQNLSQHGQIVIASIFSFALGSVAFYVIGFLCRHFAHVCRRPKQVPLSESGSPPEEAPTIPLYDVVLPKTEADQELKVNANIAYATKHMVANKD